MPEPMPTRVVIDGRPWWSIEGRLLPVVSGGEGGDGEDKSSATDDNDDKALGSAGEKALEAMKERARKAEAELKTAKASAKEADSLRQKLEEIENQNKSEREREIEKAVKEAEERVRNELTGTVNARLVNAEIRAAAAGKLSDPEDAVRFLDASGFTVNSDGTVDGKAVSAAVESLVKERPYLAGNNGKNGRDVDQGARRGGGEENVTPGLGRLQNAYAEISSTSGT